MASFEKNTVIRIYFRYKLRRWDFDAIGKRILKYYIDFAKGRLNVDGVAVLHPDIGRSRGRLDRPAAASTIQYESTAGKYFKISTPSPALEVFESGSAPVDVAKMKYRGPIPMKRPNTQPNGFAYLSNAKLMSDFSSWIIPERKALRPAELIARKVVRG